MYTMSNASIIERLCHILSITLFLNVWGGLKTFRKYMGYWTYPSRSLHGVVKTGVYDVLLGGTRDPLLEGLGGSDGDATSHATEAPLKGLLHGFCKQVHFY